jgi:hypothetical protein
MNNKILKIHEYLHSSKLEKKSNDYQKYTNNYMFFFNLKYILKMCKKILEYDENQIDNILFDGHEWAEDHVSVAQESITHVYNYLNSRVTENKEVKNYMFFNNITTIKKMVINLLKHDTNELDVILSKHDWISDHVSKSKENIKQVYFFIVSTIVNEQNEWIIEDSETEIINLSLNEKLNNMVKRVKNGIIYRGETFPGFNKPKKYTGKGKFKKRVLAKDGDKIKVLNYGHVDYSDFTKHKDTERRKNFRSRHKCDPVSSLSKLTKRYWACQDLW